ncbi:hypothetical protein Tco_1182586 [Tanacetum coccineum]
MLHKQHVNTTRNGDDSHSTGVGNHKPCASCYVKCNLPGLPKLPPLHLQGHWGVVGLTHGLKDESVFSISNCTTASQVKFATCTLQDDALTWWNAHVKTTTPEAAHAMPWATLKKKMTENTAEGEIRKNDSVNVES